MVKPKKRTSLTSFVRKKRTVEEPPRVNCSVNRSSTPQLFGANLVCPEFLSGKWVAPQIFRGVLVVRPKIREEQNLSLHPHPEKRYIGIVVYINFARGCCGATRTPDPYRNLPRFLVPETRPGK